MKKLLNFSTHPGDPGMFGNDWTAAASFLNKYDFDGYELYPVGNSPFETIPEQLIEGIHLRFFIFLRELWHEDEKGLLDLFGDWETVDHFYGGKKSDAVVKAYSHQLNLAQQLGCSYVVFHPVHCDLNHIDDWKFPYRWQETMDLCSEVLNAALKESNFTGQLLFENLWWPGSFRLEDPNEYMYLREKIDHDNCGIVLDTAHLLNSCGGFDSEVKAIDDLEKRYLALAENTASLDHRPTVVTGTPFSGRWYIEGGKSFIGKFLNDAGADYIFKETTYTGAKPMDIEPV